MADAGALFRIWRGDPSGGNFRITPRTVDEGMVVLDAVHRIQAQQAPDLAVRWNCKAGKCGSCSAEINGMPKLMCMTRLSESEPGHARDRRADARVSRRSATWLPMSPGTSASRRRSRNSSPVRRTLPDGTWRMQQADVERVQEFRKCIECFLCQDVCHVLREHHKHDEFIGPRFLSMPPRSRCIRSIRKTGSAT